MPDPSSSAQTDFMGSELPPLPKQPYLDSSVFLAHIKEETLTVADGRTRFEVTTGIFNAAKSENIQIFTSFITLSEVRRLKEAKKELSEDEREKVNGMFREFMEHEWIFGIEVNREIGEKAQEIGATFGIAPMDALHIATAIWWECDVFFAWDKRTIFNRIPGGEIEGVRISEPYWEGITPMPSK